MVGSHHLKRRPGDIWKAPTRSRSYAYITGIPQDTLIHILWFLSPREIIFLRRTCKELSATTKLRTVWVNALHTMCNETEMFKLTFPMEKMTVSELEYAATCHYRFLARLWAELPEQLPLDPVAIRVLKPHPNIPPIDDRPVGHFKSSVLVPGGRFLITTTTTDIVQLWDLGYTPRGLINHSPLASVHVRALDYDFEILLQPSSNGKGIRLLLVSTILDRMNFAMFEIHPTSDAPSFCQIAVLTRDRVEVDAYTLFGNRFSFHGEGDVVVWDYIHDRSIKWEYYHVCSDIIFSDNDVILAGMVEFAIFKIPILQDMTSGIVDVGEIMPVLRVMNPLYSCIVSSEVGWQPCATRANYFDNIGEEEDGGVTISRYVLKPVDNAPSDGLPTNLPILVDSFKNQELVRGREGYSSFKMLDGRRLISWVNEMVIRVHLSVTTTTEGRNVTGTLWRWPSQMMFQQDRHHAFCPLTGRLCVSSWDHEIRVLDYTMPPN